MARPHQGPKGEDREKIDAGSMFRERASMARDFKPDMSRKVEYPCVRLMQVESSTTEMRARPGMRGGWLQGGRSNFRFPGPTTISWG